MDLTFDFKIHTCFILKINGDEWGQTCHMHSLDETCINILDRKPESKKLLDKFRSK
jgi:hypothetical protein